VRVNLGEVAACAQPVRCQLVAPFLDKLPEGANLTGMTTERANLQRILLIAHF